MQELNILLIELLLTLGTVIFLFIYSTISIDILITMLSLLIFLSLLFPCYLLSERMEILVYINSLETMTIYNLVIYYSWLINIFIGVCLFIQLLYLLIYS